MAALLSPRGVAAADRVEAVPGVELLFEQGAVIAARDGKEIWRRAIAAADPAGVARLEAHPLAGERVAVHAAIAAPGGTVEAVVEVGSGARSFRLVWEGRTDPRGDPGERTATKVAFQDLTGDGLSEIVVGIVVESVRLCGVDEPPLLFRRVWDPAAGRLRPVTAGQPGLRSASVIDIPGVVEADAAAKPLFPVLVPAGASSSAGDRGDPLLLVPPGALVDGDPATAWIPGSGNGAGEFASFSVAAANRGLTRLGLRLLPEGRKGPGHGRPASLLLAAEDRVHRLVPPPNAGRGGEVIRFDLPEPLRTTCLSLVVEAVEGRAGRPPALAELVAFTEVDGPGGLLRLSRELDDGAGGDAAAALLPKAGAAALGAVEEVWPGLSSAGRRRAVRVVVELVIAARNAEPAALERSAALLVEAALGGDEAAASAAAAGLDRLGEAAVAPLAAALGGADEARFARAARLLADLEHEGGLVALADAAGTGGKARRKLLRGVLAAAASRTGRAGLLIDRLEKARDQGGRELLIDLARAAARVAAADARLADVALPAYDTVVGFADRYRLLEVVASLRDVRALPRLLAAAGDEDHLIRAAAISGLALHGDNEDARAAVRRALSDGAPEVRIAALEALARFPGAGDAAAGIADLAGGDPWPRVRIAAVSLAPLLPEEAASAVVAGAVGDGFPVVREAGLTVAARFGGSSAVDAAVLGLLENGREETVLRGRAARVAGRRCQIPAVGGLRSILVRGAEPLAPPEWVEAAKAAAKALGAIGGKEARTALEEVRRRSNPAVARAIDEALGRFGSGCAPP
jgi:HEAT repeat protein